MIRFRAIIVVVATGALLATAGCATRLPTLAQARAAIAAKRWAPRAGLRWQIQLHGAFDPADGVDVYDLDPYQTSQQTVATLHAGGRQAVCHLDVGVSDTDLPDAGRLDGQVIGSAAGDDQRWLDIRQWGVIEPVLRDRMVLCRDKDFDAVDADKAFGNVAPTGFNLTSADQLTYDRRVASLAHRLGLRVTVRSAPALTTVIEPFTDFGIVSGCFEAGACANYFVYIEAGKAVFDVETGPLDGFCPVAAAYGFATIRKHASLDAYVQPC